MARELNGTSDFMTFTVSSALQALVAGPLTMVAIINVLDTVDGGIIHARTSGGTNSFWMEISGGAWNYGQGVAARALVVPSTSDGWAMYAGHKAAGGANQPAGRKKILGGAGTNATAASGLADGTAPGVGGILQVGKWGTASEFLRARLAALAIFGYEITADATLDAFAVSYANLLSGNGGTPPVWCIHCNQASATDPITDDTGNGGNSVSITGTTIVANPPGYFSSAIVANLGILTETSSIQGIGRSRIFAIGQLQETDSVQAVGKAHARGLGTLTETNVTQGLNRRKIRTLGQLSEADSMLSLGRTRSKILGLLSEADTTQQMNRRHVRTLGQIGDSAAVLGFSGVDKVQLGLLSELNSILPMGRLKKRTLGMLTETNSVFPTSRKKNKTLGLLSTVDYLLGLDLPVVVPIIPDLTVRTGVSVTTVTTASEVLTVRSPDVFTVVTP